MLTHIDMLDGRGGGLVGVGLFSSKKAIRYPTKTVCAGGGLGRAFWL